ncbi:MAG: SusD/RagB family nutrient-binding outer membrane lipoprotein, partial [Hymenobacter sp.]
MAIAKPGILTGNVPQADLGWPTIPGVTYTGLITIHHYFNYGSEFNKGLIGTYPIKTANWPAYPALVSKVDRDGNEVAGIRLPPVAVPVGTLTGWALRSKSFGLNDGGESAGQFIPFKLTKAERLAAGDPRLSLEERYSSHQCYVQEVIKAVTGDGSKVNLLAEARIWRVYCFSRLTDLYGDIPYSQAGQGYTSSIYAPVYDAQKDIYANMLAELEAAASSLDATKTTFGTSDLVYGGNTTQWKKFAYSLMLRLGMRMTKVDATMAQTWATKAIAGGVILADADVAKVAYV